MSIKTKIKEMLPERWLNRIDIIRQYTPKGIIADMKSNSYIVENIGRRSKHQRIKVAFIVQMAEIWDKEEPIYDAMDLDDRFDPSIIVVPEYDRLSEKVSETYEKDNYFFKSYDGAIKAYENGAWIDLEECEFDYIFLQRPYDHYLPEGYRSYDLVKFSKVCYVPYGFSGADVFNKGNTNKAFFRNIYFSFLESDYMVGLLKKKFVMPREKRLHKILNVGYPALLPYFSFPERKQIKNIMWTPRWSFDPVIGGSNFLKFKDAFIQLAKTNPDYRFIFRPHPLMFGEILKQRLMTQSEIDSYIFEIKRQGITYDKNTVLNESLRDVDILITDYSSIIVEFFISGRPIIYCESCIQLNGVFSDMKRGMYVAKTPKDLLSYVGDLLNGQDPMKPSRDNIIGSRFEIHKHATANILHEIYDDYYKREYASKY